LPFHKNLYEQIQYDTAHGVAVQEPPESKPLWPLAVWCAVPGALLLLFAALRSNRQVMDSVVFGFTTPLKHHLSRLNDHIPFALGEALWGLVIVAAAVFLVRTIWLLVRGPERLRILLRRALALLGALLFVACSYTLMWGCNYYATSFTQRSNLSQRGLTTEELTQLTAAFAAQCTALAPDQDRDENGAARYDIPDLFKDSAQLYTGIEQEFPVLQVERHDPKAMICSRALSLTGFSGFYFPMTAESIVNVDQTPAMIPSTILHELAHQCNVAEEDAANFVAILAGLRCEDPRFQYSSALLGYIHLSNALFEASPDLCRQVSTLLSDQVRTDLGANNRYWADYETPVSEASEQVYNGFLNSYGHSEGMKSYGLCVNLLSAYYYGENGRWAKTAQEQAQQEQAEQEQAAQEADAAKESSDEGKKSSAEDKKTSSKEEKKSKAKKSSSKEKESSATSKNKSSAAKTSSEKDRKASTKKASARKQ
jgi:hypothetical protein